MVINSIAENPCGQPMSNQRIGALPLFQRNLHDNRQAFSETARLTSAYKYDFTCIQSAYVHF